MIATEGDLDFCNLCYNKVNHTRGTEHSVRILDRATRCSLWGFSFAASASKLSPSDNRIECEGFET